MLEDILKDIFAKIEKPRQMRYALEERVNDVLTVLNKQDLTLLNKQDQFDCYIDREASIYKIDKLSFLINDDFTLTIQALNSDNKARAVISNFTHNDSNVMSILKAESKETEGFGSTQNVSTSVSIAPLYNMNQAIAHNDSKFLRSDQLVVPLDKALDFFDRAVAHYLLLKGKAPKLGVITNG